MKRIEHFKWTSRTFAAVVAAIMLSTGTALAGGSEHESTDNTAAHLKQEARDAWLQGKLETALLFNEHLNSFNIDTEVEHGTAFLTGEVESGIDKDLAGEVAKSIDGIDEVENDLTISPKAAANARSSESYKEKSEWRRAIANATLTAKVKSKLLLNDHTSGMDINVDSSNGVVTLSGTVDSREEADLAVQIAQNVDDTQQVNDHLQIRKSSS